MDDAGFKAQTKDGSTMAALCYLGGIVGQIGLIVPLFIYLNAKDDKFVRFHALQAMIAEIALYLIEYAMIFLAILLLITIVGYFLMILALVALYPLIVLVRFYLAYRAYKGEAFMLPKVGEFTIKNLGDKP